MTSTATPVSAATEQEHYHNDNQDQFHANSPLMAMALFAAYQSIQQRLQSNVPDKRATPQLALRGMSNSAQSSHKFKRAIRLGNSRAASWPAFRRRLSGRSRCDFAFLRGPHHRVA
jgi:hypothetical protein